MKDTENENGVNASSPAPIAPPGLLERAKANKGVVIGAAVLLVVAIASIVHHWHMGG